MKYNEKYMKKIDLADMDNGQGWDKDQQRKYLEVLLRDCQRARSIHYESSGGQDAVAETVGELVEPWLYGEKCIVPALVKCLDGDNWDKSNVLNFSIIAQRSQVLRILGVNSKRHDPTIEELWGLATTNKEKEENGQQNK